MNDLKKKQFHSLKPRGLHLLLFVPNKNAMWYNNVVNNITETQGTNNVFICCSVYLAITRKTVKAVNDNACGIEYRSLVINKYLGSAFYIICDYNY